MVGDTKCVSGSQARTFKRLWGKEKETAFPTLNSSNIVGLMVLITLHFLDCCRFN